MTAVPNGVPIGLDELIATRERWVREHLDQRPPWWRPLDRLAWRAELEQLEVMPLGEVARRMRRGEVSLTHESRERNPA